MEMHPEKLVEKLTETSEFLKSKTSLRPKIGLVLGSGLGDFVKSLKIDFSIPYNQVPHLIPPTVEGHSGNLIFGKVDEIPVMALQGRIHYYEGHSMESVVFPVRTMAIFGIQHLILTNSAGGLGDQMKPGDFMVIEDHINLMGTNPLMGPNTKSFGPRFPDLSEAYDLGLRTKLEKALQAEKAPYHKGVYGGLTGPTYETPAEVRYLKMIGCSAVGMSTVPETIAANHMGLRVVALSCITNLAAGIAKHKLSHTEVTETAKRVESQFARILTRFIREV